MIVLAPETVAAYERRMENSAVAARQRSAYLRWVRFYLDFCQKYGHPPREEASMAPFLEKLAAKKQSEEAGRQARCRAGRCRRRKARWIGSAGAWSNGPGREGGVRLLCWEDKISSD